MAKQERIANFVLLGAISCGIYVIYEKQRAILKKLEGIEETLMQLSTANESNPKNVLDGNTANDAEILLLFKEMDVFDDENKASEMAQAQRKLNSLVDVETTSNSEILWRTARTNYHLSKEPQNDVDHCVKLLKNGVKYCEKCLRLNPNSADGNLWMSILLGTLGDYQPIGEKIANSIKIRDFAMRAIELNPNSKIAYHVLGTWCYEIAKLTWFERTAVKAIASALPDSSYAEALQYLKKADEIDPRFFENLIMMGRCYRQMGKKEQAKECFTRATTVNIHMSVYFKSLLKEAYSQLKELQ